MRIAISSPKECAYDICSRFRERCLDVVLVPMRLLPVSIASNLHLLCVGCRAVVLQLLRPLVWVLSAVLKSTFSNAMALSLAHLPQRASATDDLYSIPPYSPGVVPTFSLQAEEWLWKPFLRGCRPPPRDPSSLTVTSLSHRAFPWGGGLEHFDRNPCES
jgi:hypothetical protein